MEKFNATEAQQRLSSNPDFVNIMRAICKVSGWNTVIPDRTPLVEKTVVSGKVTTEVVREEPVSVETIMKYNGKREVWHQIRTLLGFSPEMLAKIEHGIQQGDLIKNEKGK